MYFLPYILLLNLPAIYQSLTLYPQCILDNYTAIPCLLNCLSLRASIFFKWFAQTFLFIRFAQVVLFTTFACTILSTLPSIFHQYITIIRCLKRKKSDRKKILRKIRKSNKKQMLLSIGGWLINWPTEMSFNLGIFNNVIVI